MRCRHTSQYPCLYDEVNETYHEHVRRCYLAVFAQEQEGHRDCNENVARSAACEPNLHLYLVMGDSNAEWRTYDRLHKNSLHKLVPVSD